MSDISLTSGMRANLQSLQASVKLLDRTQERLSTGKKVNSALDNPTNFFTALSHTSRANDLLAFKDSISESIQTIKAADVAVKGITTLIESAKALAEDAKGQVGATQTSQTLKLSSIASGATISIGGEIFTAVTTKADQTVGGLNFFIGGTDAEDAFNLANLVNQNDNAKGVVTGTVSGDTITFTMTTPGATVLTSTISPSSTTGTGFTEGDIGTGNGAEAAAKVAKYTEFVTQITNLQKDAYYKGKNLLGGAPGTGTTAGTNDMTVRFGNDHTLLVRSFDGSAVTGLRLSATATGNWASEGDIAGDITKMETALATLRIKSSDLSSNLAIINTRDEWITNIAATLQTGADKLTLADTNEEGANMLMLQTRQSLSTSALSMSAQAAQSVLRLFQ